MLIYISNKVVFLKQQSKINQNILSCLIHIHNSLVIDKTCMYICMHVPALREHNREHRTAIKINKTIVVVVVAVGINNTCINNLV